MRFDQGPARPVTTGLPFENHRTMQEVMKDEREVVGFFKTYKRVAKRLEKQFGPEDFAS